MKKNRMSFKEFISGCVKDDRGEFGVGQIITIIIVVTIGGILLAIFKDRIASIANSLFDMIENMIAGS